MSLCDRDLRSTTHHLQLSITNSRVLRYSDTCTTLNMVRPSGYCSFLLVGVIIMKIKNAILHVWALALGD
jgi:hypothetical protein